MLTTLPVRPKPPFDNCCLPRFAQLATAMTGLEFPECRLPDLTRALRETMMQFELAEPDELYNLLAARRDHPVKRAFISHLTIGETHFFRNQPQFDALAETILPELIARRRPQRRLRIWSAACATGEEPYSVAIVLDQLLPDYADWDVTILATDIDEQALARARRGIYSAWSFRQMDETVRVRYFITQGRFNELTPAIRRRVTFAPLNLVEADYPSLLTNTAQFDLILCRNVLIYFAPATTRQVVDRLYMALADGGWLLVGHAEPSQEIFAQFATVNLPDTVVYRRPCLAASAHTLSSPPAASLPAAPPRMSTAALPAASHAAISSVSPQPSAAARVAAPAGDGVTACQRARDYAGRRQWREAEQWVGLALEQQPLLGEAHYLHALLLLEAGQIETAITALRRCIYVAPTYIAGHLLAALLYQRQGEVRRAAGTLTYARHLLQRYAIDAVIPDTDGATAGQLLTMIEAQLTLPGVLPERTTLVQS